MLLVPGMELSCGHDGVDVHVLAYAFDPHDERIASRLQGFREGRERRGLAIVERLSTLGYRIDAQRVEQLAAGGAMGRPHVARALVEAGYVSSVSEAFDKLSAPASRPTSRRSASAIDEAIELIRSAGGVTSIAHPTSIPITRASSRPSSTPASTPSRSCTPRSTPATATATRSMARFRGKFTTGGSDDHGTVKTQQTLGTIKVPETMIGPILERM